MNDREIVELFWERREEAVEAANEKYGRLCYSIAHNMLHSHEDAQECVNDTWYSAWKYIPPARPEALGAFLAKITRGLAIDRIRKLHAGKRLDVHMADIFEELEMLGAADRYSLEEEVQARELNRRINDFLKKLSAADRDIFLRRYWFADSIGEIAERHGCSESRIKSNLFRNRKRLRAYLERSGI